MRTPVFSHEQLLESILLRSFQAPSAPYILAPSSCTSIIELETKQTMCVCAPFQLISLEIPEMQAQLRPITLNKD